MLRSKIHCARPADCSQSANGQRPRRRMTRKTHPATTACRHSGQRMYRPQQIDRDGGTINSNGKSGGDKPRDRLIDGPSFGSAGNSGSIQMNVT